MAKRKIRLEENPLQKAIKKFKEKTDDSIFNLLNMMDEEDERPPTIEDDELFLTSCVNAGQVAKAMEVAFRLAKNYDKAGDQEKAVDYCQACIGFAEKMYNKKMVAEANLYAGNICLKKKGFKAAFYFYGEVQFFATGEKMFVHALQGQATVLWKQKRYEESLAVGQMALEKALAVDYKKGVDVATKHIEMLKRKLE